MKRVSTPKTIRQQHEDRILRDMATIRGNLSKESKGKMAAFIDAAQTDDQPMPDAPVDKTHVMSIISHFTALKRAVKF